VAPDLRGYGRTGKPAGGYDKRSMAGDIRGLMDYLGEGRAALVGHDRGARVATRFAKDYPGMIDRLVVMDNIPTREIYASMDAAKARAHWFFIFNSAPDLPEALIAGREETWLRYILQGWTYNPELFSADEIAEYVRAYSAPGAIRGACSDYRAGTQISCPTLALWGEDFELVGKMWDVEGIWRAMAADISFAPIPRCGHLPHEERPDLVNQSLLDFLQPWKAPGG